MTRLTDRLGIIEQRLNPSPVEPEVIIIRGGLPGPSDPMHGMAGNRTWQRGLGEPFTAFRRRVLGEARGDGAGAVVFGGMPNE